MSGSSIVPVFEQLYERELEKVLKESDRAFDVAAKQGDMMDTPGRRVGPVLTGKEVLRFQRLPFLRPVKVDCFIGHQLIPSRDPQEATYLPTPEGQPVTSTCFQGKRAAADRSAYKGGGRGGLQLHGSARRDFERNIGPITCDQLDDQLGAHPGT
jgi:hypothetical protein